MSTTAKGVVEVERRIEARPETVFSYFTDPARFVLWFGMDAELDPRPGGTFLTTVTGRSRMVARGTFLEVQPPTRVVYTWGWEPIDGNYEGVTEVPSGSSTVEVVLEDDGGATILRLRHSGLPTPAACDFHIGGWEITLDRLVIVASGGDPGPNVFADL